MPAAFRPYLVLHVNGGHTRLLQGPNGARNIEGTTPAGVDVHQQRKGCGVDNSASIGENVFHRADAKVGQAEANSPLRHRQRDKVALKPVTSAIRAEYAVMAPAT